jgi:putative transposase
MIMDIFSRKIVGYAVHDKESSEHAAALAATAYHAEGVKGKNIILHSDNGSPMKGATMLSTLQQRGVTPSFSRSSVSHDNPYFESLFKTLKYGPEYPSPQQRHDGSDILILEERKKVYEAAKARMPARWSRGIRNWDDIKDVFFKSGKKLSEDRLKI